MTVSHRPSTLGELKKSGYRSISVKDEMRNNLIAKLKKQEQLFPGIVGYEQTVIPALVNAILARHDIILLGLRGQAKSRIVRELPSLLDEFLPVIKGSEINDDPFHPVSKYGVDLVREEGDNAPIEWISREARFSEKLATPDVTIADLIGDIDPIKAATQRLHYSHEGAIHFGLIPRANRGIFAINELPDLQPRIQVGLFNILEEKDIQIRGFNIRFPLDVALIFTANPEDYTNRGNIVTPLKDRIDSQILTHYPRTLDDAIAITTQEAWVKRNGIAVEIPRYFREIIEHIAFEARKSEFVDQKSGVSARLTIAAMENLASNIERRAILLGETKAVARLCDLPHVLPGLTGKLDLVFEGEQEGSTKVSRALISKAVRRVFASYFPDPLKKRSRRHDQPEEREYAPVIQWFESGNVVEIGDELSGKEYLRILNQVSGLHQIVQHYLPAEAQSPATLGPAMEFVLDGLHQNSKLAREDGDHVTHYKDMVGSIFTGQSAEELEE